jgi:HSP20 family protein
VRHEVRCGSFSRTLPLPEGVTDADISANYKDGILEIRVPTPKAEPVRKITIGTS